MAYNRRIAVVLSRVTRQLAEYFLLLSSRKGLVYSGSGPNRVFGCHEKEPKAHVYYKNILVLMCLPLPNRPLGDHLYPIIFILVAGGVSMGAASLSYSFPRVSFKNQVSLQDGYKHSACSYELGG
jgi:hypothetical protein